MEGRVFPIVTLLSLWPIFGEAATIAREAQHFRLKGFDRKGGGASTGRRNLEKWIEGFFMLYAVKDLSPEQKQAAEILLGHPVSEEETVSIKSLSPSTIIPSRLSPEERIEALRALDERFAKTASPDVSEAEEEAVVNEALRSTRPNYRPIS
jgi:hypothetical protein